jgi:hypothetical protein
VRLPSFLRKPTPPARITARRTLALPLGRTFDIIAIEDGESRAEVWLRIFTRRGHIAGQLHTRPSVLRGIAATLTAIADEVGVGELKPEARRRGRRASQAP